MDIFLAYPVSMTSPSLTLHRYRLSCLRDDIEICDSSLLEMEEMNCLQDMIGIFLLTHYE